ncbi:hypothetical protein [Miniphocaeibacter massiliensis]|uniref:hypothetical protein n=1 Tax=Miniphocaeibacter massiliensis TaxID=2041841 RepID=UPI000C1B7EDF|nr:hypothetical protein [Miniphocaeibacter massiliensis]
MKFIKNVIFDIKYGTLKNVKLFLMPIIIAVLIFVDIFNNSKMVSEIAEFSSKISLGDFIFYTYGGIEEYIPSPDNPFVFPVVWMVIYLSISFILLNYPVKDMHSVGSQILLRSNSRVNWWLSKCMWNVLSTIIYHGIILFIFILLCSIKKIPLINEVNLDLQWVLLKFRSDVIMNNLVIIPIKIFVNILLLSIFINLLQMTMSLFIKPVFSFLAVAIIMLSSSYLLSPVMVGNYGMFLRYNWIYEGGVSFNTGVIVLVCLIFTTVVIGLIRFKKYDILDKD